MEVSRPSNHEDIRQQQERTHRVIVVLVRVNQVLWVGGLVAWIIWTVRATLFEIAPVNWLVELIGLALIVFFNLGTVFTILALERSYYKARARLERLSQMNSYLLELQQRSPELVTFKNLFLMIDQEKDAVFSRRGFWVSAGQNLFFLVLGIFISYLVARLGWFR